MALDCLLTSGFSGIECNSSNPGAKTYVFFANESEIASYTAGSVDGLYTNITFDAGKGLSRYEVAKDSLVFRESLQGGEEDLSSYNFEVEFNIKSMGVGARNAVQDLNGPNIVAIVPTKNGEFIIAGKGEGMKILTNEATTAQDSYGETVVLQVTQMSEKRSFILDTDEATTLALLEAKVVAS